MTAPFCLVTCADREVLAELETFVANFRLYNHDVPIVCVGAGLEADSKRLGIEWVDYPAKWDFKNDCGAKRCLALREGLKRARWALYADCDVTFVDSVRPAIFTAGAEVILSRHNISPAMEKQFGKYNSGYIATRSEKFCDWWPEYTRAHPEMYFEQQPLEHAPEFYKCAEFSQLHNLGWWQYYNNPQRYKQLLAQGPVSIHGHLKRNNVVKGGAGFNWQPEWAKMINEWLASMQPKRIVVFALQYRQADAAHQIELDECLQRNRDNTAADAVIILGDEKRQNLNDVFELAAKEPKGTICATLNADCYFDETLCRLRDEDMRGKLFVISRIEGNGAIVDNPHHCQDAWAWLAENTPNDWEPLEFGRGAVDHKIVFNAMQHGLEPVNIVDIVRVVHLHRDWKPGPGRHPSYDYPHGLCWPRDSRGKSRTFIRKHAADWPAEQTRLKYPRMIQRRDANGKLSVGMADDKLTPAPRILTPQRIAPG